VKIEVDLTACRSYALCVGIAPEYFELDDDDVLHILVPNVAPEDEERVREAALVCPTLAITLIE
jgi:ferredoxin